MSDESSSNSSWDELMNIVLPPSLRNNPQVAAAAAAVPAPVAATAPVAKQSGALSEEAELAVDSDEVEPAAGGSDSSVLSGYSGVSVNAAKNLIREQHNEEVRAIRIMMNENLFELPFDEWPPKYIILGLKYGVFNDQEKKEVLNKYVYEDYPGCLQIQSTATTTAASGEKKDTEEDDGDLKPAAAVSSLIRTPREEAEAHEATCGDEMGSGDKKPAAITTAAAASGERKLPPPRKNISGPPSHNAGSFLAQTPDFDTLRPDYEAVALSRLGHLESLWSSPVGISVESSTSKPLTITSFKGGLNRVSLTPETAGVQSDGPSLSIGPNGIDIPQLPQSYLNTLAEPPKCLAVYNGKGSNNFLFMDFIVRSWWRYLIEEGHLPDDEIESEKTLQEKFDAIYGEKFYELYPKDRNGQVTAFPAHLIKEITHSGDRQLRPEEYNIPKLLAFFRAQDNLAGSTTHIKKIREKVACQMQYPFGTDNIPEDFEMSRERSRLVKKKKRKADGNDRSFIQTIGHTIGRVAFPVNYLFSSYEKWQSGKLIFASPGDSGTVGDGFHMFVPTGIDKLKGQKPSDPATARKSLVEIHDKLVCDHKWPVKLFKIFLNGALLPGICNALIYGYYEKFANVENFPDGLEGCHLLCERTQTGNFPEISDGRFKMTCTNEETFNYIWSAHHCTNLHHVALASKVWNLINKKCTARVRFTVDGTTHLASYCRCDNKLWDNYQSGHGGTVLCSEVKGLTKAELLSKHNPGRAKCRAIREEEKPDKEVKAAADARGSEARVV